MVSYCYTCIMMLKQLGRSTTLTVRSRGCLFQQNPSRFFCLGKSWELKFPDMAETKEAMVEKWLKKEGQTVTSSDNICEVSLFPSDLMVGVTSSKSGILAKILVPIGKKLSVNEPIALLVEDQAEYMEYLDATRCAEHDAEGLAEAVKVVEDKKKKPDTKVLLREIKHLIQEGHIKEDSEFARGLLSAARKSNAELMSVFEASFEGDSFDSASFDREFFLDNAVDIVDELKTKA